MNILAILGYVVVLFLVAISLNGFHCFYFFADGPSIVFTIAFLLLTLWGTGTMADFVSGIKIGLNIKKSYSMLDLKKAEETLQMIMKSLLIFGSIMCLMSWISMLYLMSEPTSIGPIISQGMIGILYALLFSMILTPFKVRIHILLISYAEENSTKEELDETALDQRVFYLFRSKGLTDREAEIARLISQEMTNREIAGRLYISEATVKKHITHILEKLKLEGREAIVELILKENNN
uniref:LuxR C-terminal-related transcriptional regulator n=1 Tax=Acetatifactor sp. TaxID=1872090 RepID=UPI004055D1FC